MRANAMTTSASSDPLLDVAELAAQIRVPQQTIYRWRTEGRGPRGIKIGRHLRYRQRDIDAWIEAQSDARPPAA